MADLSLYSVSGYQSNISYVKNDIVLASNNYYYSLVNNNSNNTPTSSTSNIYWGGYRSYSGLARPEFFWNPSYSSQLQIKPAVNVIKFGNGYEQRTPDGVNNNLLRFDLLLEGRDKNETRAIAHFLHKRKASDSFFCDAPFPYNFDSSQSYPKRFVCEEWNVSYNFYDNYNISIKISETSNI
jgi:phage-related protein